MKGYTLSDVRGQGRVGRASGLYIESYCALNFLSVDRELMYNQSLIVVFEVIFLEVLNPRAYPDERSVSSAAMTGFALVYYV